MEALARDLRFALRLIRKAPVLSIATILTLAIGIGLNAGVFTVLSGLMLRPRVTVDRDSFVHLDPVYSGTRVPSRAFQGLSTRDYVALRDRTTTLRALSAWSVTSARVGQNASGELTMFVTCNFFQVYGLDHFERGRTFTADECRRTDAAVAVISDEMWQHRFSGAADILNTPLLINGQTFTIVGVTPPEFAGRLRGAGIWMPYTMEPAFAGAHSAFDDPSTVWLSVDGRLAPGASRAAAEAELGVLLHRQDTLMPGRSTALAITNGALIHDPVVRPVAMLVLPLILSSVGLVLLIACGNVTLLLLSRAIARQREIAIRLAIGCSRARLSRMLLTESVFLAALGMPLSIWLAWQAPVAMRRLIPQMPYYPMNPDATVISYLAAVSIGAGLMAGLAPVLETLRQRLTPMLAGHDPLARSGGRSRMRDALIAAQIGMSLVLVAGTALLLRAERAIASRDPSVDAAHVMTVTYAPPRGASPAFMSDLSQRLTALPGVRSIAYASSTDGGSLGAPLAFVSGRSREGGRHVPISVVSQSYFATMNQPLLQGRGFVGTTAASSLRPLVISDSLARLWWPSASATGARVDTDDGRHFEVVGVVHSDVVFSAGSADTIQAYTLPPPQPGNGVLFLRFDGDTKALQSSAFGVLREMSPVSASLPITLAASDAVAASSFFVMVEMVGTLGIAALVLALVGIYGVVSFAVGRRTREIGIRLALGATRGDIVRLILSSGVPPIAMGIGLGFVLVVPAAIALSRVFQYTPVPLHVGDPVPYAAVAIGLAAVALATMIVPARRASAVPPSSALRTE
jgi:macrolide transport system ATP-binding/permease protein